MKVFISQPVKGRTAAEIEAARNVVEKYDGYV